MDCQMKYQRWEISTRFPAKPVEEIIRARGVRKVEAFLSPDYETLAKPEGLPGVKGAVTRIFQAASRGEAVGIFMDYDADGLCGGAIIYRTIVNLVKRVIVYVPRRAEGYGLSKKAIDVLVKGGAKLIITVDCGIRDDEKIAYARRKGVDIIVADHHQLSDNLPKGAILVHPKIPRQNKLKFRDFSGGGVAFMLAKAIFAKSKKPGCEKWLLDLAAISSLADVVPLRDDNRLIVKFGLLVLNKTRNLGLQELIKVAGCKEGKINCYEVGFMLAPRLNAAGRIDHPHKSFALLTSEDEKEAKRLAQDLNELNCERQALLNETTLSASAKVVRGKLDRQKIILLRDSHWSEGIIGLVASRMVEKFCRPTIIVSGRDKLRGSARSIAGVNIVDLIGQAKKYLLSFGGHPMAAGLSLDSEKFPAFEKKILRSAQKIDEKLFTRTLKIDAVLNFQQVKLSLAKQLEKMAPFGPANPRPIFCLEKVEVKNLHRIGADQKHLRFSACNSQGICQVVAFSFEANGWHLHGEGKFDLAFSVKVDEWQGRQKLDLILEDARESQ